MSRHLVLALALLVVGVPTAAVAQPVDQRLVTGTVVDDLGAPIGGATVSAGAASVSTGSDGAFSVAADSNAAAVQVSAAGHGGGRFNDGCLCFDVAWRSLDGPAESLRDLLIVMPRNAVVTGRAVLADTGAPAPDVCLLISGTFVDFCRGTSDRDGRFTAELPADVEMQLFTRGAPPGYSPATVNDGVTIRYEPGSMVELDLELLPHPWLTGTVVDELGRPLSGLEVIFLRGWNEFPVTSGLTDAEGGVRFSRDRFVEAPYRLSVRPADGRSVLVEDLYLGRPGSEATLVIRPGETADSTTDGEGDGATVSDPIETTLRAGGSARVTLEDGPGPAMVPSGFQPLDASAAVDIVIELPQQITTVELEFELDRSLVTGVDAREVVVFADGRRQVVNRAARQPDGDIVLEVELGAVTSITAEVAFAVPMAAGPVEIGGWDVTPHRSTVPQGLTRSTLLDVRSTDLDGYGEVRSATSWVRLPGETVVFGGGNVPVELDASTLTPGTHTARIEVLDVDGVVRATTFEVTVTP